MNTPAATDSLQARKTLGSTSLAHFYHDGASDLHYLLFALWQQQFGLNLTQIGLLKTLYSGTLAGMQIPAGELGHRFGERYVLAGGTLLLALALFCYALADGLGQLMALIVLSGLGASVQHPLAASVIARHIERARTRVALSIYNFFGDIGKGVIPSFAAGLLLLLPWGSAVQIIALGGIATALLLYGLLPRNGTRHASTSATSAEKPLEPQPLPEASRRRAFSALCLIGCLDNTARAGTLTFLPFLLTGKGASPAILGFALTAIFVGGALGKLACGTLATRFGILRTVALSEIATATLIAALTLAPLSVAYWLLLPLGVALNGTSSVLYGSVAELAPRSGQTRAFAVFYTASLGCGALMPLAFGALGDHLGLLQTLLIVALLLFMTLPLLLPLRILAARPAHNEANPGNTK